MIRKPTLYVCIGSVMIFVSLVLWLVIRRQDRDQVPLPQARREVITNSIGLQLVPIYPGVFRMGSYRPEDGAAPVHAVKITKPFFLGVTEVTCSQWQAVMGQELSKLRHGEQDHPVVNVSWEDCQEFCRRLTEKERAAGELAKDAFYSLPTEAEWEYACRAGSTTRYYFGNDMRKLPKYAWYEESSGGTPHDVARKEPNAWGLYDMHGNVSEWCQDRYDDRYEAGPPGHEWYRTYGRDFPEDPRGPAEGAWRVVRGGSWRSYRRGCQSCMRTGFHPANHYDNLGFRVCLRGTTRLGKSEKDVAVSPDRPKQTDLPPALQGIFVLPDSDKDQYGNPVTRRNAEGLIPGWSGDPPRPDRNAVLSGSYRRRDTGSNLPNEIWLKDPRIEFVLVPAGQFEMGSEKYGEGERPVHTVFITKPFYLGKYEVTRSQWTRLRQMVDGDVMWLPTALCEEKGDHPDIDVRWKHAHMLAGQMSKVGVSLSLPTEAEWEYACRAGSTADYYFGDDQEKLGDYAWYVGNSQDEAHRVGQKKSNAWGLYDMLGNVSDWCEDWYDPILIGPLVALQSATVMIPQCRAVGQGCVVCQEQSR